MTGSLTPLPRLAVSQRNWPSVSNAARRKRVGRNSVLPTGTGPTPKERLSTPLSGSAIRRLMVPVATEKAYRLSSVFLIHTVGPATVGGTSQAPIREVGPAQRVAPVTGLSATGLSAAATMSGPPGARAALMNADVYAPWIARAHRTTP